jgi:DNA-binding MarR family transcriptional regulator
VCLTDIADNYIVHNMTAAISADRQEHLDYVAEHLLSQAAILVRLLVKQVRSKEISRTEMQVLGALEEGPRRIMDLTELEGTAQPTMTLLVKRLEEKGWLRRDRLPDDGRVAMISLTKAGRAAFVRFRTQFLEAMRADLRDVPDEQLECLAAATETIGAFVEGLKERA